MFTRCIGLLLVLCFAQTAGMAMTNDLEGTIGSKAIGMTFGAKTPVGYKGKTDLCGYYFYNEFLKDIPLETGNGEKGNREYFELDMNGNRTAVFKLTCPDTDPQKHFKGKINGDVMVGTWSHLDGSGSLPVYLMSVGGVGENGQHRYGVAGVENDEVFEAKVQRWRNAVLEGNKKLVVSEITYPISASVNGKNRTLKNAAQLLANYDGVFTKKYIAQIHADVPHNMFVRYDGVMIGNGDVWFDPDGKVKALNN